jgi:hypothetical protein
VVKSYRLVADFDSPCDPHARAEELAMAHVGELSDEASRAHATTGETSGGEATSRTGIVALDLLHLGRHV